MEPFSWSALAPRVPNLKLDLLAIDLDGPDFEVNAIFENTVAREAARVRPSHAMPVRWRRHSPNGCDEARCELCV